MLLDLLSTHNYGSYNIYLAGLLGLQVAVYLNELVIIDERATRKGKVDEEGYFVVDRKYIAERTTIQKTAQIGIDKRLQEANLLSVNKDGENKLKLDMEAYMALLSCEDRSIKKILREATQKKGKEQKAIEKSKAILDDLKINGIKTTNPELQTAYFGWIDSVYGKYGCLSKSVTKIFEDTVNNYAKGDLDKALDVIRIATIRSWRDCKWAIETYEKDRAKKALTSDGVVSEDAVVNTSIKY